MARPESPIRRSVRAGGIGGELQGGKKGILGKTSENRIFKGETSFNKYIRLRKGEWCWKEGSVRKAVTAPAAPTTWLDPHRPGKGRREPTPHKLSSGMNTHARTRAHIDTYTHHICVHSPLISSDNHSNTFSCLSP